MATWLETIDAVCTVDDVLAAIFDTDGITNITHDDSLSEDETIAKHLAKAKNALRRKLQGKIRDIFLQSGADYALFCSSSARGNVALDTALDKIKNADELQEYLVAATIERLYIYGETVVSAGIDFDERVAKRKLWKDVKEEAYKDAFPLLGIDFNEDDTLDDTERLSMRVGKFQRG